MILVFRKTNEWLCDEQNVIQYIRMRICRNNNTETALIPTIQFWGEKGAANSQSAAFIKTAENSAFSQGSWFFKPAARLRRLWCEQGGATESDASPLPFWAEAAAGGKRGQLRCQEGCNRMIMSPDSSLPHSSTEAQDCRGGWVKKPGQPGRLGGQAMVKKLT